MALACFLTIVGSPSRGAAEETVVPSEMQAELLSKLSLYDRSFAARAGEVARILILVKTGNTRSSASASAIQAALGRLGRFGGLSHVETLIALPSGQVLAKRCRDEHIALVYLTAGLESEIEHVRSALLGVDVLTAGALPEYVEAGLVLGFELRSGKPKMLINYEQAKRQNVNFAADVLKLMKVVSR